MPSTTFIETTIPGVGRLIQPHTTLSAAEVADAHDRDQRRRERSQNAIAAALAKIDGGAARAQIATTKSRARAYLSHPGKLNALHWNLSQAAPADGLRLVERLIRAEPRSGGFVDIPRTNLAAARLAFRWASRFERPRHLLAAE